MTRGLQKIFGVTRRGQLLRALVLFAALMSGADALGLIPKNHDSGFVAVSSVVGDEVSQIAGDSHSSEGIPPCSDGDHCHQHHCQILLTASVSITTLDPRSFGGMEHERVPLSPFLDRVPRPPSV